MKNNVRKPRAKIVKKFGTDFSSHGGALTLDPSCLGKNKDGWEITGVVHEDYYEWVNDFEAVHKKKGYRVWGNFEDLVYATSERAFQEFYKNYPPESWDYYDI